VLWGAGPRASQFLVLGAKARAVLMGRMFVTTDDIRAIAPPVLRHRLKLNFNADAAGVNADEIIRRLLAHAPVQDEKSGNGKVPEVFRSANAG
jgi:MoxR-like ATPase